jgi:hypothetical protein
MQHVLLTRFNVRLKYHAHANEEWMEERLKVFEAMLLPSVAGQTNADFTWLVFFDEFTNARHRERVRELSSEGRTFIPVYISDIFSVEHVRKELVNRWPHEQTFITTRVDNDDALAREFMATIRSVAEPLCAIPGPARIFLNPTYGIQFDGQLLYVRPWPWNAFMSLVETGNDRPLTVFVDQHYSLAQYGECREVGSGDPLWLQYIHGGNLANRVNGIPLRHVESAAAHFPFHINAVPAAWGDTIQAVGRVAYRTVRNPSKLRGPLRVLSTRMRGAFRGVKSG